MTTENFAMFTDEGNQKVAEIARQAREYAGVDGPENPTLDAWKWAKHELQELAKTEQFGEAMDTMVRECVYDYVVDVAGVDFYA